MSGKKNRKRWKSSDKMRIVLTGMEPGVEISELCRREGVHPTQYYTWKKQLQSNSAKVFDNGQEKPSRREQRLEEENARLKAVIAEITSENLDLKKTLSD